MSKKHKKHHQKHVPKLIAAESATRERRTIGFGNSLEKYIYGRIASSPLPWSWIGIAIIAIVLGASLAAGYWNNSQLTGNLRDTILLAARHGDYETAQRLYDDRQKMIDDRKILGVDNDLEDEVYPEHKVEQAIQDWEQLVTTYPYSRDIDLGLSQLFEKIGNKEKSQEYREKARILDPNNEIFK